MTSADAPAKINLALVVGPLREDGKHEVSTVLQRIALCDRVRVLPGPGLTVTGFDDTIVTAALTALAAAGGIEPAWSVEIEKTIPVAAGLGGGSSDAAVALRRANELLPEPLGPSDLAELAATIGADVPFFLTSGAQLGSGDGSSLAALDLPGDYSVVLLLPANAVKMATGDVYRAFDVRNGADGYGERREALRSALASVRTARDLALLPPNDLASSPLAEQLRELGAFRADVSGAGPCVYGLFEDRATADEAAQALRAAGETRVTLPV
jgi:4-diphosphocytidyl-2-C-methyl-D-erythritol kinase